MQIHSGMKCKTIFWDFSGGKPKKKREIIKKLMAQKETFSDEGAIIRICNDKQKENILP